MANTIQDLLIKIGLQSDGAVQGFDQVQQKASSFASNVTGILAKVSFAGISIGAVAASEKFEAAAAQMQRSTGATAEKLKGLEQSFANVYKQTAASSEAVSSTLALLSTRTQATGKDLEDLTLKTLKLAKTQNEDAAQIVPLVTRVFGDWGIAASQQASKMDYLRVVSQQTGTQVSRLAEQVVYAGAPLRQLGYSFEQSVALIGKFEKEGVNTELVLGGMKAALQKFAKEGITDTAKAWQDFVAGVKSGAITFQQVSAEVGAKRAVDLFKAIQEGRFEIDKFVQSAEELQNKVAPGIETMHTKFVKLQHQIETTVAAHRDLILSFSLAIPALTSLSGALLSFGGVALPVLANITTAVRYGLIGALSAAELAVAGLIAALPALLAVGYAIANKPKGGSAFALPGSPGASDLAPSMPKPPSAPSWALNFKPYVPGPSTGGGGDSEASGVPPILHYSNVDQMVTAEIVTKEAAAFKTVVAQLADWAMWGRHVSTVMSDMSKLTLDETEYMEAMGKAIPQIVNPDWSNIHTGIAKTDELMAQLGVTSTHTARQAYEATLALAKQVEAQYEAGYATASDVRHAAEKVAEAHKELNVNINGTAAVYSTATKAANVFGRQVSTVFTDLSRQLADVVMGEKSIGDAFKDVGKAIVRIILEDIIANAIGRLMKALSGVFSQLGGIGKALGTIFGGGSGGGVLGTSVGAAGGAASTIGGGASSAASSAGGAVSSGLMGTIGAIASVGTMVSSIIGNFQNARMENTMNAVEESTRYLKIGLVTQGDSLLNDSHVIRNTLTDFMKWNWNVATTYFQSISSNLDRLVSGGVSGGSGSITFNNCTFGAGLTQQSVNDMMTAALREARLSGAIA